MRPKANEALVKLRSTNQAHINRTFYAEGASMAEAAIRSLIEVEQIEDPHFGHHDWVVGEVSALVEYRSTTYAKPGDVVLLTQDLAGVVSFYSVREALLCVAAAGIKPLMGWDEAFAFWREKAGKSPAKWIVADPEDEDDVLTQDEPWLPPPVEDHEDE